MIRQQTPGGTITRQVYHARGWVLEMWVGTNDNGATDSDPSGGGAPNNNMVKVAAYEYDSNSAGQDGNRTKQTQYENASTTRVTTYGYDFRNRLTSADGEVDFYEEYTYDNLDRVTQVDRKDTTSGGNLIARSETNYDNRGRVYQQLTYAVSSGTAGNSLAEKTWYDPAGNVMKRVAAGTRQFEKLQYDQVGRLTRSFRCYDTAEADTNYSAAGSVTGNTVQQQGESTYDNGGNVIQAVARERFHDATGTGELTTPGGSQPKARASYAANYPDALGRQQAVADYGTNAAASFTRSATIPTRADTRLVTATSYNSRGEAWQTTDPLATVNQLTLDDAGRQTKTVENYVSGGTNPDQNRETNYAYNADGNLATLTAKNSVTGDQVTLWTYGTTLSDSDVARSDLLRYKQFPDGSASDRLEYKSNRLGEIKEIKDQIGTVRTTDYDKLGRLQHDRVTTLVIGGRVLVAGGAWLGTIAASAILLAYAGMAIVGPARLHRRHPVILRTATVLGLLAGGVFAAEIILEYILLPTDNSRYGVVEFGTVLFLYLVSALISGFRSRSVTNAVWTSVACAFIASLIWVITVLAVFYAFRGSPRQELVLRAEGDYEDFAHSGMRDFDAFIMGDFMGATFFHLTLALVVAAVLGAFGGVLGKVAARYQA